MGIDLTLHKVQHPVLNDPRLAGTRAFRNSSRAYGVSVIARQSAPQLVRNADIEAELRKLGESADFTWIAAAADRLADVERGMRRNLLRSLSLDAFATALEKTG